MKRLKDLGFKKVRGTEPGFVMYELTPARLVTSSKSQAASNKPQAASCDNLSHLQIRKRY
jgi:hypothetical protein